MRYQRFNKKNSLQFFGIMTLVTSVLLSFQNCSNVSFEQAKFVDPFNAITRDPTHNYSLMTVGTAKIPDLKMVFVVDNSYTMTANQVNLAQSFENMLSEQSSSNLTPFNTTTYLFNTAQVSLPATSTKIPSLENLLLSEQDLLNLFASPDFNATNFLNTNRPEAPAELSGAIPGDTYGYSLSSWGTGQYNYKFAPMPVLGFGFGDKGFTFQKGIYKPANVKATDMVDEFQARLGLLKNLRSKANYPEVSDNESAMCALSRILHNHEDFFKPGDIPAFVIVSDENEANLSGDRCVDSYSTFIGNEDLIKGYCEERRTTINGTYIVVTPPRCEITYKKAYTVSYDYTVPSTRVDYFISQTESPRTKISYYKSNGYVAPRTTINYSELTSQTYKRTQIEFYLRVCEIRDGVVVPETCRNVLQAPVTVDGDKTSNCVAATLAINGQALNGSSYLATEQPKCTSVAPRVLSASEPRCSLSDPNCASAITAKSTVVYGVYSATQADCLGKAATLSKVLIDDAHQPACAAAADFVATSGVCLSTYPGCLQNTIYMSGDLATIVDNDYTLTNEACQNKAKTLPSAYVNSSYPAVCEKYANKITPCDPTQPDLAICPKSRDKIEGLYSNCADFVYANRGLMPGIILNNTSYTPICSVGTPVPKSPKQNIDFTSAILTNPLPALNTACSGALKSALLAKNPSYPTNGTCLVTGYTSATSNDLINVSLTCDEAKALFDATNSGTSAESTAKYFAKIETLTGYSKEIQEQATCSTACAGTGFCVPGGTADTSSTLENYLKSIYGNTFTCSTGTTVKATAYSFADKLASTPANVICPVSSSSVKRYLVQDGPVYRYIGPAPDFVSGSQNTTGQTQPATSLAQYINDRSAELFGHGTAVVTTFVRQPQDGNGSGGSVGVDYEHLADLMGGQKYSVMMNDYSPALKEFGKIVKSKLERAYVVPGLVLPQKIYNVWIRRIHEDPVLLDPALWTQAGATLILDESVDLNYGEHIQAEFY